MCQYNQVYNTLCTCVSFSQTFFKELTTQLATPLDPSNDAKLDTRVALDDRYANKFAPLDSTAIYPKPMTSEMKCPRLYLYLAHSIPSPMLMQHMHQPITK